MMLLSLSIASRTSLEHLVFRPLFLIHRLSLFFSLIPSSSPSLSPTSFLCVRAAVRTSLRTFMIPRCVSSIHLLCPAHSSFLSRRPTSSVGQNP
jgi:hypothetical protein